MMESPAFWILLAASTAFFYTVAGYPLLLRQRSRRPGLPVRKDHSYLRSVTVLVAAYNAASFIREKLDTILALDYPRHLLDILIVSDGSTDETDLMVEEYGRRHAQVRLLRAPRGGKSAALNAALPELRGEIVFFTDVRQRLDPGTLRELVANFADPEVGAVSGELRFLVPGKPGQQAAMDLYWRYEVWARTQHSRIDSMFSATGAVYGMRHELIRPFPPDSLNDDVEIPLQAFFAGYRIVLDRAAVAYDFPTKEGGEFRRKMRTLAGLWQVFTRHPSLLIPWRRMRWHFLSHKFARLLLPWIMLTMAAAAVSLPSGWFRTALLVTGCGGGVLALVDPLVPPGARAKVLTSRLWAFLSINWGGLLSIFVFVVPARFWWPTPTNVDAARATKGDG